MSSGETVLTESKTNAGCIPDCLHMQRTPTRFILPSRKHVENKVKIGLQKLAYLNERISCIVLTY